MYLGIDFGLKRVGLAIGDRVAIPKGVVSNDQDLIRSVFDLIVEVGAEKVIIGQPIKDDGREGDLSPAIQKFATDLGRVFEGEIIFEDESDTTSSANQKLIAANIPIKKSKEEIDAIAAAAILQQYIDNQK
jgi:putative Holliday junction resolvase